MSNIPPRAHFPSPRVPRCMPDSPKKSSPTRRVVLGELTPNARISRVSDHTDDAVPCKTPARVGSSPLKRSRPVTPAEVLSAKRRRESSEERQESPVASGVKRRLEDATDVTDDADKRLEGSVLGGLGARAVLEDVEGSSTEGNTPEPADGGLPEATEASQVAVEDSGAKGSFSSLIDYDPSTASDKSHTPSASPPPLIKDAEGSESLPLSIKSQAEALRLRLRVAMYKVRTGQIMIPMSQLNIEADFGTGGQKRQTNNAAAQEHRSLQLPAPKALGLLPAPVLKPTAYSSRFIREQIPSSPPARNASPRRESMPAGSPGGLPQPATRTSSPLKQVAHLTPLGRKMLEAEENLTSSAVKGRAADGLLELMRAH